MPKRSFRGPALARLAVFCLGTSGLTGPALAATTDWSGGTGDWFTAGNWSAGVPGTGDTAIIGNGGTAQIGASTATIGTVNIANGSTVTLLGGGALNATNTYIGSSGGVLSSGTLLISSASALGTTTFNMNGTLSATTTTTTTNNIIFNAGTDSTVSAVAGTTLNLTGNLTFNTSASDGHTLFIGSLSNSGTVNVAAPVVTLGPNPGPLEIVGGTLVDTLPAGVSDFVNTPYSYALGKLPSVTIDSGATLDIESTGNGRNQTTDSFIRLFGSGQLVMGGNTPRIVLGDSNFAGQISGSGYVGIGGFQTGAPTATAIFTGNNNSAIEFQIGSGSTLQIGAGGTTGSLASGGRVVGFNNFAPGGDAVLKFDRSDNVTLDRFLVGNLVLQQAGGGILTVAANNKNGDTVAFSGSVVVLSGGLSISSDNNLNGNRIALNNATTLYTTASGTYTSPVTVAGDPAFNVAPGTTTSWSGQITDGATPGDVDVTGGGTLILTNASNSYSGGTSVSGATLQVTASGALGAASGTVTVTGGTLDLGGTTQTQNGGVTLNGGTIQNGTLSSYGSFNLQAGTVSAALAGSGAVNKTTSGTIVLTGANSYTGGTTITAGTLQLGTGGSLSSSGALAVNGGTFDLNGRTQTVGDLTGTGGLITLGSGSLTTNSNANGGLAAVISGSGSLTKTGTGTLVLLATNTYTGGTTIAGGTLSISNDAALGGSSGVLTLNSGILQVTASTTSSRPVTVSLGTTNISAIYVNTGSVLTENGAIGGNGVLAFGSLSPIGANGTVILNAVNTYTDGTNIESGTVRLGAGGQLPSVGGLAVNSVLDLNGQSQAIDTLFGSGSILLNGGSLTVGSALNSDFGGSIQGNGTLTKTGAGTLMLTGANTYTGGTTIAGGTLSISSDSNLGNGGTVTMDAGTTLAFTATGAYRHAVTLAGDPAFDVAPGQTVTYGGVIADGASGGTLVKVDSGTLVLTAHNTYSGGTTVGGGTLQVTGSGTLGATSGSLTVSGGTLDLGGTTQTQNGGVTIPMFTNGIIQNGTLSSSDRFGLQGGTVSAVLAGSGAVSIAAESASVTLSGANTYTGGTYIIGNFDKPIYISGSGTLGAASGSLTMNNGVLDLGGTTQIQNGGVTFYGGTILDGTLSSSGTFTLGGGNMYASLAGTGEVLANSGGGIITELYAVNSYTGPTIIQSGYNALGLAGQGSIAASSGVYIGQEAIFNIQGVTDGGTSIANLSGNGQVQLGSNTLTLTNASGTFSGVIFGTGGLALSGGSETLSGANTYTGGTTVSAGTLTVTGSVAGPVTVSGGTLNGTGKVGATSVASGGTLTPGSGTAPGTLTISGNLTLASGSNFADSITPTAAGLASVSGAASINGNAIANFASGTYANNQQYTLITAAGGVSGTFSSLAATGLPTNLRASLSYDANDIYLNLRPNALAPSLASNTTTNQHNVVAAIDAAVTSGAAVPSGGFNTLYNLTGAALNSAIDQISSQAAPNVSNAVGQSFLSFLAMSAEGGAGEAGNFAPGSAYGAASAPHRAQLDPGETRVWGAAYGGHVGLSGDAGSGAAALSASNVGLIGGADMQLGDGILAGVTLGWGRQHFNSGNGSGISSDYAFGIYGRYDLAPAYVTAAFGYGWHQITTLRVVTVSGTDVLQGKENADDFGGRIEAGWRLALDDTYSFAPYGAFAGESFESPAYAETALSGASTFALSYAAHTSTLGRSELGAHLDRAYDLGNGALTADVRAAWAHQLDDLPFTQANFENLATAGFQVAGVRPTRDAALLGADLELHYASGLFLGLKGEGQFGAGTTILEGMGRFGLHW